MRTPHVCPKCLGDGKWYGNDDKKCVPCSGTGIVWDPQETSTPYVPPYTPYYPPMYPWWNPPYVWPEQPYYNVTWCFN